MKSTSIRLLTVVATLVAASTINADVLLSPRAAANQTRIVSRHEDPDLARVQLGEAARAKSSGDYSVVISGGVKDQDLVRGANGLGVAAKSKATGTSPSGAYFQVAPLK